MATLTAMPSAFERSPAPARVLVRGVNWLGDAVMTTPALMRLREALPGSHLALLTPAKLRDLWEAHPAIDEVIPTQREHSPWAVGRRLRGADFGAALVFPNSLRSALECFLARIPVRVGFGRGWRGLLLTCALPPRPGAVRMVKPNRAEIDRRLNGGGAGWGSGLSLQAHHSFDYLHLAAAFGASGESRAPCLRVLETERRTVRAKFGIDPAEVWLGLNPGAEYGPAKRWPAERFAEVARAISAGYRVRWVLLGGMADREITARIAAEVPAALDLAGRTNLRELMAVLAEVRLLLTNDTGPMHVAAALGTPVLVPFGSTSPELTGPGQPGGGGHGWLRAGVACAPCFLRHCPIDFRCMTGITVDRVVGAVAEELGRLGVSGR